MTFPTRTRSPPSSRRRPGRRSASRERPTAPWTAPKARSTSDGTGRAKANAASSDATATRITAITSRSCAGAGPWWWRTCAPTPAPCRAARRSGASASAPSSTCRRWRRDGLSACSASMTPGHAPGSRGGRLRRGSRGARRFALERIASEERRHLRTNEVAHRLKNLLAMVQAIAARPCGRPSTWRARARS